MSSGVALIGASAIALSPIVVAPQQVHLPTIPVSSIATTLTAQVDPISAWVQVLTASFNNLSALGQQVAADPAPILKQIIINQLGYANTTVSGLSSAGSSLVTALQALPPAFGQAGQQLAAGDISGGINTVYQAVVSLVIGPGFALLGSGMLDIPGKIAQNITNVVKLAPNILIGVGFSALSLGLSVESAFADTAQAVYNGVHAGNVGAALNAIVNAPAVLTNAFLNGYNTAAGGTGILTPVQGLVSALVVGVRDMIAQALGAPVPAAAAAAASPHAAAALPAPTAGLPSVSTLPTATDNTITVALKTEPKVKAPAAEAPAASVTPPAATTPAPVISTPAAGPEAKGAAGSVTETPTTPSTGTGTATDGGTGATGSETSTGSNPGKTVRDSGKAVPGKTGAKSSNPADGLTKAINSAGENLKSSLDKIGDGFKSGLKNGFGKPAKPAKPSKGGSDSAGSGAGASSGGSSSK
ncbi:hypothetical protein FZI85_29115 [Mycobacterium sp. CBMA293]|uniref:hypothetical protein n=1 Tax=unclassified Mycolicibacterium TaxID=2636767 RepID=UPI0012DC2066|nr:MULTISPECIES: hypothetical protein [unclassified Mycolicibacterium]MUL49930.1 hypothetical protein [Mycolicibacterium sp. CBMA 360]MUL74356.1 hypothetical protein [Mycolicibacterium sp. CBMA 311]MUL96633.1 hypothetical protein [Mycolicibacterium sp. CBMA 230]MUM15056.1 hypothetical protein [Mycolicibacterium sp. CBMA 293]MUL61620.1 hypothetical protein [Mycolicibacterium sp. CBMA 335]